MVVARMLYSFGLTKHSGGVAPCSAPLCGASLRVVKPMSSELKCRPSVCVLMSQQLNSTHLPVRR